MASVLISITSVSSKGIMFSYSSDRPTFIFNFLCIVCDVFSVFCTGTKALDTSACAP